MERGCGLKPQSPQCGEASRGRKGLSPQPLGAGGPAHCLVPDSEPCYHGLRRPSNWMLLSLLRCFLSARKQMPLLRLSFESETEMAPKGMGGKGPPASLSQAIPSEAPPAYLPLHQGWELLLTICYLSSRPGSRPPPREQPVRGP